MILDQYGKVYAMFNMGYSAGMIIGPVIAAAIYAKSSFSSECIFLGVTSLAMALLMAFGDYRLSKKNNTNKG